MKDLAIFFKLVMASTIFFLLGCNRQKQVSNFTKTPNDDSKQVGGPFENGDFHYIDMPKTINAVDTSPGWNQPGQKLLVTGTMFKPDGKTPAPGVVLYYYHTDISGHYANKEGLNKRVVRHGYIRGWVKSDQNGKYAIYTVRPASYPNTTFEAHIHPSIKEPGINKEYYIDEFVFDDDKLLTADKRKKMNNRGGSGILRVVNSGDLQIAEHNIILGLNIPNYPLKEVVESTQSGLKIGEDVPSFMPFHAYGPDKGSKACPVCKYGRYHGIIYFVGNKPNWVEIKQWLLFLEQESIKRSKYLKAYFVYGNEDGYSKAQRQLELEKAGTELNLRNIALTYVPSMNDTETEIDLNKIDPSAENTFIIYKNRTIIDKYTSFSPTTEHFNLLINTLNKTKGDYFELP